MLYRLKMLYYNRNNIISFLKYFCVEYYKFNFKFND